MYMITINVKITINVNVNVINFIPGMSSYPVQNTILIAKITHLLSCSLIVSVTYP